VAEALLLLAGGVCKEAVDVSTLLFQLAIGMYKTCLPPGVMSSVKEKQKRLLPG